MTGNTFGKLFTVTTFGESHGPCYGCIIDGCPPGLALTESDIQIELDKRKPGASHFTTQRRESDLVKILSGVFEGLTTGTPIGLLIENTDAKSKDYTALKDIFRPGHADFTYAKKYGIRDYRGGGRASARETMLRVAAGAIAKKYLLEFYQIKITAYLAQIGDLILNTDDLSQVSANPFFCPDAAKISNIEQLIVSLRKAGDSIGAKIGVEAQPMPVGLGQPVFDGLDASLAHALMSINAVKGVEIGDGFAVVQQNGSYHRDEMTSQGFLSNHSGGTLGGISSGQPLRASVAFKPTSSIPQPAQTRDVDANPQSVSVKGRHDTCVAFRAVPIVEAMVALVLIDMILIQFGYK